MAKEAGLEENGHPIVLNASNEIAVSNFLEGKIKFTQIPKVIEKTLIGMTSKNPKDINEVLMIDNESRIFASDLIKTKKI